MLLFITNIKYLRMKGANKSTTKKKKECYITAGTELTVALCQCRR